MAIAVPYFGKRIVGSPVNRDWLDSQVKLIFCLAERPASQETGNSEQARKAYILLQGSCFLTVFLPC